MGPFHIACSCSSAINFQQFQHCSFEEKKKAEKEKAKKAKEKDDKQKASFSCVCVCGRNLLHTCSHIFGAQSMILAIQKYRRCREQLLCNLSIGARPVDYKVQ